MTDPTVDALVADLLEWLGEGPRPYAEVMDAWRTSCPRFPVWEVATSMGLVRRISNPGSGGCIAASGEGREFVREYRSR